MGVFKSILKVPRIYVMCGKNKNKCLKNNLLLLKVLVILETELDDKDTNLRQEYISKALLQIEKSEEEFENDLKYVEDYLNRYLAFWAEIENYICYAAITKDFKEKWCSKLLKRGRRIFNGEVRYFLLFWSELEKSYL